VAYSPTSLRFTREQSVGDPISYDFVVTILISWCPKIEVVAGSPTPEREEPLAREISFQPCKEVIEVRCKEAIDGHRDSVREDEQADVLRR
jgi:hypothetical protein